MNLTIVILDRGTFEVGYMNLLSRGLGTQDATSEALLIRHLRKSEKIVSLQSLELAWIQIAEAAGWVDPEVIDLGIPFGGVQSENLGRYIHEQRPLFENITFLLTRREVNRLLPTFFSLHRTLKGSIYFYCLGGGTDRVAPPSRSASPV